MQRSEGLIHILTGDGNGKTTSAIGIAVRAAGIGMKVALIQFLKGGLSSEIAPLEKLGVTVVSGTKHCPRQREHAAQLKEKGFESAYLKNLVVARVNPLRFVKGAGGEFDVVIGKMLEGAKKFDVGAVKKEDKARMGGAPAEPEE